MKSEVFTVSRTRAVGVVVPIHNEERRLGQALLALEAALECLGRRLGNQRVVLVLDSCRDSSREIAESWRQFPSRHRGFKVTVVECEVKNVGRARAIGCQTLLQEFAPEDPSNVWIATTDADSQVPQEWLASQIALHERGVDVWAGRVAVIDWPLHRRHIAALWQRMYDAERHPIHGANLGFNAGWYVAVGGFPGRRSSEDRGLYEALRANGARIHHDAKHRVVTSARRRARAPEGFAAALTRIESSMVAGAS